MGPSPTAGGIAVLAALLLLPTDGQALEWSAGGGVVWGIQDFQVEREDGLGLDLRLSTDLSLSLEAMAGFSVLHHFEGASDVAFTWLDLCYKIDIISWIPVIGIGVTRDIVSPRGLSGWGADFLVGLFYRRWRHARLGWEAHYLAPMEDPMGLSGYLMVSMSAAWVGEW